MASYASKSLLSVILACALSLPAAADEFVVDGIALGERVNANDAKFRPYRCAPSTDFHGLMACNRSEAKRTGKRKYRLDATILHAPDGTSVYLMVNVAPVQINSRSIENELATLSSEIGRPPTKVLRTEGTDDTPSSTIAVWGDLELAQLGNIERETVAEGRNPQRGILVDSIGDAKRSAGDWSLAIYRLVGKRGYVYAASFDSSGKGHRHYIAIDATQVALRQHETIMRDLLDRDANLAADDFRLWPDVAAATRNLALDTSVATADRAIEDVFSDFPSKKLFSHVWPCLPGSAIIGLSSREYRRVIDFYGPNTEYPKVRKDIQAVLASHPTDPFIEFAHYVNGDVATALAVKPNSPIAEVLHYASGHAAVRALVEDGMAIARKKASGWLLGQLNYIADEDDISHSIAFLNANPQLYDFKPLSDVIPKFSARAKPAKAHFAFVLDRPSDPHADDAAYMLGWLAFHEGDYAKARTYFSQAMKVGNADYKEPGAMKQMVRILERDAPDTQLEIVEADSQFVQQPALWYTAARSAYREFDYAGALLASNHAMRALGIPADQLPVTTDPERIYGALERIDPRHTEDINTPELVYVHAASREILDYRAFLDENSLSQADEVSRQARRMVLKYSFLKDRRREDDGEQPDTSELAHRDLRQAIHLIDMTLKSTAGKAGYADLREWLYYRKARVAAEFVPEDVAEAVAALRKEAPASSLLDDALAEQMWTEGVKLKEMEKAKQTFQRLIKDHPSANAVDNAYSWMAIILRCAGQIEESQKLDREIITRFPMSRHARYAGNRLANPSDCGLVEYLD